MLHIKVIMIRAPISFATDFAKPNIFVHININILILMKEIETGEGERRGDEQNVRL